MPKKLNFTAWKKYHTDEAVEENPSTAQHEHHVEMIEAEPSLNLKWLQSGRDCSRIRF
jgi:hypothetical protein